MTQLNDIKLMNQTMIVYLKKMGISTKRNEIINQIFNDEACFFKMNREDAYIILKDVGIKENIDAVYSDLISNDVFYDLYKKGKIEKDNEEIIIKYKIYDNDNLFIKNKDRGSTIKENEITIPKETFINKIINKLKSIFKKI